MTVWRHVWWNICRSLGLAVALHGCASSGWVHPSQPPADLAADQAACYAQLTRETQGGAASLYVRRAVLGLRGPPLHAAERLVTPALAVLVPLRGRLRDRAPANAALLSSLACAALGI